MPDDKPFRYKPEWDGPLSGPSFEKQTEDAINALHKRIDDYLAPIEPYDDIPNPPAGAGTPGTSDKYARGDHVHPPQENFSGTAESAKKLSHNVVIGIAGDASGSATTDFEAPGGSGTCTVTIGVSIPDAIASGGSDEGGTEYESGRRGLMTPEDKARIDAINQFPRISAVAASNSVSETPGAGGSVLLSVSSMTLLQVVGALGVKADVSADGGAVAISIGADASALAGEGLAAESGSIGIDAAYTGLMTPGDRDALASAFNGVSAYDGGLTFIRANGDTESVEVSGGGGGGGGGGSIPEGFSAISAASLSFFYDPAAPCRFAAERQPETVFVDGARAGSDAFVIRPGEPNVIEFTAEDYSSARQFTLAMEASPQAEGGPRILSATLVASTVSGGDTAWSPNGPGLSIADSSVSSGGVSFSGLLLDVVYAATDSAHSDGPTSSFGSFNVSWAQPTPYSYSAVLEYVPVLGWSLLPPGADPTEEPYVSRGDVAGSASLPASAAVNDVYGISGSDPAEYYVYSGALVLPVSSFTVNGREVPVGGGIASGSPAGTGFTVGRFDLGAQLMPDGADLLSSVLPASATVVQGQSLSSSSGGYSSLSFPSCPLRVTSEGGTASDTTEYGTFDVLWTRTGATEYSVQTVWNAPAGIPEPAPEASLELNMALTDGSIETDEVLLPEVAQTIAAAGSNAESIDELRTSCGEISAAVADVQNAAIQEQSLSAFAAQASTEPVFFSIVSGATVQSYDAAMSAYSDASTEAAKRDAAISACGAAENSDLLAVKDRHLFPAPEINSGGQFPTGGSSVVSAMAIAGYGDLNSAGIPATSALSWGAGSSGGEEWEAGSVTFAVPVWERLRQYSGLSGAVYVSSGNFSVPTSSGGTGVISAGGGVWAVVSRVTDEEGVPPCSASVRWSATDPSGGDPGHPARTGVFLSLRTEYVDKPDAISIADLTDAISAAFGG